MSDQDDVTDVTGVTRDEEVLPRPPRALDLSVAAEVLGAASGDEPTPERRESCAVVSVLLVQLVPMVERLEDGDLAGAMGMLAMHGNPFQVGPAPDETA